MEYFTVTLRTASMQTAHFVHPSGENESSSASVPEKPAQTTKYTTKRIATFHNLQSEIITDLQSLHLKQEMSPQEAQSFRNAMTVLFRRLTILLTLSGLISKRHRLRMIEGLGSTMGSKSKSR